MVRQNTEKLNTSLHDALQETKRLLLEKEWDELIKDLKWQVTFMSDQETFDWQHFIETANEAKARFDALKEIDKTQEETRNNA